MRALLSLSSVAMLVLCHPARLYAQATVDTTRRAVSSRAWSAQEISDACEHKPGARMRLYGCPPEAFLPRKGTPLYVLDGEALPADTAGPGRAAREAALRTFRAAEVESVTVIPADRAAARFGPTARFGAVLIWTGRRSPPRDPAPDHAPPV